MSDAVWRVLVTQRAWNDLESALSWTLERFGGRQSTRYEGVILDAITRLRGGPDVLGVKARDEIQAGLCSLHVGRRGRHFLFFQIVPEQARTLAVTRILFDGMDFARHFSEDPD